MMNVSLVNVAERQQILITSSHEQTKFSRSVKISTIFVNIRLLPAVLFRMRQQCTMAAGVVLVSQSLWS
jgi:hypothetical protein